MSAPSRLDAEAIVAKAAVDLIEISGALHAAAKELELTIEAFQHALRPEDMRGGDAEIRAMSMLCLRVYELTIRLRALREGLFGPET